MKPIIKTLLIEDSPADAAILQRLMSSGGAAVFSVTHVKWLKAGIGLAENERFDLILLDLGLPDGFGIDSVVSVAKSCPSVPIIVLTGNDDIETARQCVRAGAQGFLVKSGLTANELSWSAVCAIERKENDRVSRELIHTSVTNLRERSSDMPGRGVASEHLDAILDAVSRVRSIVRQTPAGAEVEAELDARRFDHIAAELREILCMDVRKRRISSDFPRVAYDYKSPQDAQRGLLEVLDSAEDLAESLANE